MPAFDIDDLVASLSSNHIGQEAMDIAALQSQLAQSLYPYQSSNYPTSPVSDAAPNGYRPAPGKPLQNTPTATSSGYMIPPQTGGRSRSSSRDARNVVYIEDEEDEDEMEEAAVADTLWAPSPSRSQPQQLPSQPPYQYYAAPAQNYSNSNMRQPTYPIPASQQRCAYPESNPGASMYVPQQHHHSGYYGHGPGGMHNARPALAINTHPFQNGRA